VPADGTSAAGGTFGTFPFRGQPLPASAFVSVVPKSKHKGARKTLFALEVPVVVIFEHKCYDKLFTLAESLMFALLPLFKAGERLLKRFLKLLFSLPHSSHETRSIKFGPNLEPKILNVHQLGAGKPIQLATPTPGGPSGGRVARSFCFPGRKPVMSGRQTHIALGMAPLPE